MPHPVHQNASTGFHNAKAYDAHRPSYPAPAVDSFLSDLGVADRRGARVLEVAAGTGKFTEVLAARPEGFEVLATEPLASMRGELAGKGLGVGVGVKEGSAVALPVGDGWADVCIA
ncbi:SAM-dependent methyltransferase, partial [Candidatus Bathyarchaeota archaeon]|nr:SAM-dependent methyltransferase [Candidatus Bathyarchaeota archaeon]